MAERAPDPPTPRPLAHFTWLILILATLALGLLHGLLYWQYRNESRLVAGQSLGALDVAYRASIETYRLDVETRFRLQVMQPEVLALMTTALATAEADMPPLRGRLYRLLRDVYAELRATGLRQFQFHLADDRVLLRFHRPELAGDPLFDRRPSLRIANLEQHPVAGLEIGRSLPGFRYVFPIARPAGADGAAMPLGSVELSLPFDRVHENLGRLLPEGEYAFLLRRDRVFERIDEDQREKFDKSGLSPDYLQENPVISRVTRDFTQSPTALALSGWLRQDPETQSRLRAGERFAIPILRDGRAHIAAFAPIADLEGHHTAYVVAFTEAPVLLSMRATTLRVAIVASILIPGLALAAWLLLRHRRLLELEIAGHLRTARRLEQATRAAESASRAKSDFLASMSHEIRSPMNAVLGLTQLALEQETDPRQRNLLAKASVSARALLGLLNDILDYARLESGRLDVEFQPMSVFDALGTVVSLFGAQIEAKGLRLNLDIAPELPPVVLGDGLRLTQVLNNLVGNAVKFTEQGEIRISVAIDETGAEPGPEARLTLRFTVTDTGIGVPDEQADRVFEAFTQSDTGVGRKYGGTGLGLAICRELVALMGGDIQLSSRPGGGASFTFTIRVGVPDGNVDAPREVMPPPASQEPGIGRIDDPPTRALLSDLRPWLRRHELLPEALHRELERRVGAATDGSPLATLYLGLLERLDDFDHEGALELVERALGDDHVD